MSGMFSVIALQAQRPAGMETEVLAFGRLPLAVSARCFTARAHNLPKDQCDFRCATDRVADHKRHPRSRAGAGTSGNRVTSVDYMKE